MSVRTALNQAAAQLAAVSDTPKLDAELLMAHALGVERGALLLDQGRHVVPATFAMLVKRRMAHEPIAYIIGVRDFWTVRLSVGPGVLVPRPDSETLIEAAVAHFGDTGPATVLDLGTGPGTLLLAALDQWPNARGIGVDRSEIALGYARTNATALSLAARATFVRGGWADCGKADLILCNPPYVAADETLDPQIAAYEPHEALFAGADGLDDYRIILPTLAPRIHPGGVAIIEIGVSQSEAVAALAKAAGLTVSARNDLGGRTRALICMPD
ncbi:MAG: peptide chain release factor N(5)-glutamine methyltransferase [Sphingopyxis sp.]